MTEVTATSPLHLGPLAVYSRQIASRLSYIDFVLVALVVLFGGLYLYSPDQAFRTIRYVAGELAHIGPWLAGSVILAAAAKATGAFVYVGCYQASNRRSALPPDIGAPRRRYRTCPLLLAFTASRREIL